VLNIGLGRLDQHGLPEHVGQFVQWLRDSGKTPFALPGQLRGHAYLLLGYSPRPLVADNALLIGDAAGLAYAPSGEGIRTAVESGLLAAEAIEQARGAYRREPLQVYPVLLEERFHTMPGAEQPPPLTWRMPHRLRNFAGRLLLKSESFCRHTVMERWFLHIHQPALASLARPVVHA